MRMAIISSILHAEQPDIICIQENTFPVHAILYNALNKDYDDIEGGPRAGYFTSIFIKKDKKYKVEHQRIDYAGMAKSEMNRDLNIATITLQNERKLYIMTSHLESLANYEKARKNQLQIALEILLDAETDYGILCGDLNIREKEAKEVLTNLNNLYILPDDKKTTVSDVFLKLGEPKESKYTWTGKPFGQLDMKARYDRMYYTNVEGCIPIEFRLLGKDTVEDITTTAFNGPLEPSDHFGLLCTFKFSNIEKNNMDKEIRRKPVDPFQSPS